MLYMVYFRLEFSPMAFLSYLIEVSYMGRKKKVFLIIIANRLSVPFWDY